MSNNSLQKEDLAINQLYATIREKFEQDGVLREVRCLLQSRMIGMMKGKNESNFLLQKTHSSTSKRDSRINLLHQLIMEYLHWHGFQYTAEMFSMESSCENTPPTRHCLESILGSFDHKDLPILLQLVASVWEKRNGEKF